MTADALVAWVAPCEMRGTPHRRQCILAWILGWLRVITVVTTNQVALCAVCPILYDVRRAERGVGFNK